MKNRFLIPLSIFLFFAVEKAAAQCDPRRDSLVLVALYDSTNGNQWVNTLVNNKKWKTSGVPITEWFGVKVSPISGCVTRLLLNGDSLRGQLPASMSTLSSLEFVDLGDNRLTGQIPNFSSPNLDSLWLFDNFFTDTIPNFKTPKLKVMRLSGNKLSGSIPNFDSLKNLQELRLYDNELSGSIPNFNLPQLQKLELFKNSLSGLLPNFKNLRNLVTLSIHSTKVSGSIPNFNLPNLKELWLYSDSLTGSIPNFDSLKNLQSLQLYKNKLDSLIPNFHQANLEEIWLSGNRLSGSIPNFNLKNLKKLLLYENNLSGCIPYEIKRNCPLIGNSLDNGNISKNSSLSTQNWANYWNNFEGACPPLSCRIRDSLQLSVLYDSTGGLNWKKKWNRGQSLILPNGKADNINWYGITVNTEGCVTDINLSNNNLQGILPNLNLLNLETLRLDTNALIGRIPDFNLPRLQTLNLSYNTFNSNLPKFNLDNLTGLYITKSQLIGQIPNFDSLPKLLDLRLDSNALSGRIPNLSLQALQYLNLDKNALTEVIPDFNNSSKIKVLNLSNNTLNSTIPNFKLDSLKYLYLGNNQLSGQIPNFNLPNLEELYLYLNRFVTSTLPDFSFLPKLKALSLFKCQLNTTVPNFKLEKLEQLNISFNQLKGQLPDFNSLDNLKVIRLDSNKLSGCFPVKFRRFCEKIPDAVNRNFSDNDSLPDKGNFTLFCASKRKLDTMPPLPDTIVFLDARFKLPSGRTVEPTNDTIYGDTVTTLCKEFYYTRKVKVLPKDPLQPLKTAITPNDDGINDKLDLPEIDWQLYQGGSIEIFNRWGQKVFVADPYNRDWSGQTTDRKELPDGDYLFILRLKPNGVTWKGSVHIFR
ncbi:MAG: leucine-rich repeat domain-containing protein [Saprospiraceae bacterium]|nr:leucine-rich repeat domain-containing protein [Saprospiraceae bacterium]